MDPDLIDMVFQDFTPGKQMYWQHLSGGEIFIQPEPLFEILNRLTKYFNKNIGLFGHPTKLKLKQ